MNPIAVTAVQAMVAPVVLITAAAILSGALLTMYGGPYRSGLDRDSC